ncbi:hypothetical protein EDB89DRAFT_320564 [Lactarius sanguifluus]|nr:hypothetical protein EDB89DRAFT_320564 [Lactarius sanguifluus]
MFVNVGINWASTLLEAIPALLVPMPFLFYKYSSHIRTNSLTPCTDLEVVKFLEEEREGSCACTTEGEWMYCGTRACWEVLRIALDSQTGVCGGCFPSFTQATATALCPEMPH